MPQDIKNLETQVLIDMLTNKTLLYTAKIVEKHSVELQQYEYEIAIIQSELNYRHNNTNLTNPNIKFTSENNP